MVSRMTPFSGLDFSKLQLKTTCRLIFDTTVMLNGYMKTMWNIVIAKLIGTSSSDGYIPLSFLT